MENSKEREWSDGSKKGIWDIGRISGSHAGIYNDIQGSELGVHGQGGNCKNLHWYN